MSCKTILTCPSPGTCRTATDHITPGVVARHAFCKFPGWGMSKRIYNTRFDQVKCAHLQHLPQQLHHHLLQPLPCRRRPPCHWLGCTSDAGRWPGCCREAEALADRAAPHSTCAPPDPVVQPQIGRQHEAGPEGPPSLFYKKQKEKEDSVSFKQKVKTTAHGASQTLLRS